MKLACWDYNDTLVGRGITYTPKKDLLSSFGLSSTPKDIVRPNVEQVLTELNQAGYVNVVTTTIDSKSVEGSLPTLGLDGVIAKVFGGRRQKRFDAKDYKYTNNTVFITAAWLFGQK